MLGGEKQGTALTAAVPFSKLRRNRKPERASSNGCPLCGLSLRLNRFQIPPNTNARRGMRHAEITTYLREGLPGAPGHTSLRRARRGSSPPPVPKKCQLGNPWKLSC